MSYKVLGISFGGHDTAACITIDGKLVGAIAQERLDLQKHSRNFPSEAINDCLRSAQINIDDIDEIALTLCTNYYIKETYLKPAINDPARIDFLINDIERVKSARAKIDLVREKTSFKGPINEYLHHLCHVASAYYPSGFNETLIVSFDGMGEIETSMLAGGKNGKIKVLHKDNKYPNSLGLIYSAITHYLGWQHHCDEGIIMGLAPYGRSSQTIPGLRSTYLDVFRDIIQMDGDYNFLINLDWISYHLQRNTWISDKFIETFGPKRAPGGEITNHHKNIAAGLQDRLEEVVITQLKRAREDFQFTKLCIAGGVGLNCSLNGKIESSKIFDEIFVQPASGDDGTAYGACLLASQTKLKELKPCKMYNFYRGYSFSEEEILQAIKNSGVTFKRPTNIFKDTAELLMEGKIVGWYQGGSEFGPRSLGNRSILARPFPAEMKDHINNRVKFREYFRPFAPAVLNEKAKEYFHISQESPHMLIACQANPDKAHEIPAVVHVDGSCRVQTVTDITNSRFYKLLNEFYCLSNIPVLLNTSFNVKGQPVVNTPEQAIATFKTTNIDCLVIGDFIAIKQS